MIDVLPEYDVDFKTWFDTTWFDTTWFCLSLLLIVAIYFRFTRFWSLRNFDLALLLAFSPALLFPNTDQQVTWLFTASGVLLVRLLCDGLFARRPRMEQNLNSPGLAFLIACALIFVAIGVRTELPNSTMNTVKRSENLRHRVEAAVDSAEAGPTVSLIGAPLGALSEAVSPQRSHAAVVTAGVMAVLSHLAIVAALFVLGWKLFGDPHAGWRWACCICFCLALFIKPAK